MKEQKNLSNQSKSTLNSQEYSAQSQTQTVSSEFIQVYKIKVDNILNPSSKKLQERNIYLNVIFSDQNVPVFHSQCINILKDKKFFQIKTKFDIEKIEVLDYQTLKKLCKISLKGIKKEFKRTHVEAKTQIQVQIKRIHVSLNFCNKKCKMVESVIMERELKQKDIQNPDESSCRVSN